MQGRVLNASAASTPAVAATRLTAGSERTQELHTDRRHRPALQVDWLSGFTVDSGRLKFELALTPVLRCFDSDSEYGECSAAVRVRVSPVRRVAPLIAMQRCAIGNLLYDDRKCTQVARRDQGLIHDFRPVTHERRLVDLQDHNSDVVTFGCLDTQSPLPGMIAERAPCHAHTAFFLIHQPNCTIAIPTSEVLLASYVPTATLFSEFIAGERTSLDFLNNGIEFDGFQFVRQPHRCYPFRALRNVERAIFELDQLLPRACAYGRRYGAMPIIIRPPFTGRVAIGGSALKRRSGKHEYVLFVGRTNYATAHEFLSRDREHSFVDEFRFAPVLYEESVTLDELSARAQHSLGREAHRMGVHWLRLGLHHLIAGNYWTKVWKFWQKLLFPNLPLAPPIGKVTPEPYTPELAKRIQGYLGL